jgi:hypothetical protein
MSELVVDESSDQRALTLASTRIGARVPVALRRALRLSTTGDKPQCADQYAPIAKPQEV